jgi:NADPH:quinone reductase-like Zn-dependent oxidoreductase
MKSAVVHTYGESPRFEDFADPTPTNETEVKVKVLAAGLHQLVKAVANGSHYTSTAMLPMIPGVDGVGRLDDGTRVYFGMAHAPYGTMAEWSVVARQNCIPLPANLDEKTVAALVNPGISSWLALNERTQLVPGETVLILGATGVSGKLAVQIAKHLGARKVIAIGRNKQILQTLPALGADVIIHLDQPDEHFKDAVFSAVQAHGIDIIVDYLWGHPTEAIIDAVTRKGREHPASRIRLIEVGQMAGATISLPGAVLRGNALEIYGSGIGSVSTERFMESIRNLITQAAQSNLQIAIEPVPLSDVETAWSRQTENNRRIVFIP